MRLRARGVPATGSELQPPLWAAALPARPLRPGPGQRLPVRLRAAAAGPVEARGTAPRPRLPACRVGVEHGPGGGGLAVGCWLLAASSSHSALRVSISVRSRAAWCFVVQPQRFQA